MNGSQPFLFKLRLSKNVKRYIGSLFRQPGWVDAGQGWEGKGGELSLMGWQKSRRATFMAATVAAGVVYNMRANALHNLLPMKRSVINGPN